MLLEQGVAVAFQQGDIEGEVHAVFNEVPAADAIRLIATQVQAVGTVVRRGKATYYVGTPGDGDVAVRVYRVPAADASPFVTAIQNVLSATGTVSHVADRVIVKDIPSRVALLDDLWESIVGHDSQYLVEVRFVEVSREFAREIGIDWQAVGDVTIDLATSGGTAAAMNLQIAGMWAATERTSSARLLRAIRLHAVDGIPAEFKLTRRDPITVETENTTPATSRRIVETDFVETGIIVKVIVTREPSGLLNVASTPEISGIIGERNGVPIQSSNRLTSTGIIEPGGVILIGGLLISEDRRELRGLPWLSDMGLRTIDGSQTRLFVLVRVVDPATLKSDKRTQNEASNARAIRKLDGPGFTK